ncbi:ArsR/SmtB family transcription factor [Microvirga terricola]|uniref:Winged helix-turn-helix transcriptional regulator n=1 Tax=Microvirga terricola TaxID=2719797 RepID=A0ABX0VAY2_9HYPH|nr:metalloregulator ArsR/SmtB family transcription factor [Microvirga terricola]NIX76481.1 winged helix-turn-helix transcriptional regulator [Microvirga terricola]
MPNYLKPIDTLLHALSEPARRAIVERLATGPASVSSLATVTPMSLPAVMQHLAILETARLIETQKIGRVRTVTLKPGALKDLESWAAAQRTQWERKLDHLAAYLDETEITSKEK